MQENKNSADATSNANLANEWAWFMSLVIADTCRFVALTGRTLTKYDSSGNKGTP